MATIVHQCPHCLSEKISFNICGKVNLPQPDKKYRNFAYLQCTYCGMPCCIELSDDKGTPIADFMQYPYGIQRHGFNVVNIWPDPPRPRLPDHLPDQVARAYLAAERNFVVKDMEEAAAGSYGRALDIGTKLLAPDIDGMLFARIKELAKRNRVTPELAQWAHEIRLIRNYAMHEVDGTTREELIAIRGFTEMVLTYLFTLPAMLASRKKDAGAAGESGVQPAG